VVFQGHSNANNNNNILAYSQSGAFQFGSQSRTQTPPYAAYATDNSQYAAGYGSTAAYVDYSSYTERQQAYLAQIQLMRESLSSNAYLSHDFNFTYSFAHYGYSYSPIGHRNPPRTPLSQDKESTSTGIDNKQKNAKEPSLGQPATSKESEWINRGDYGRPSLDQRILDILTSLTDEKTPLTELKQKKLKHPDYMIAQLVRVLYVSAPPSYEESIPSISVSIPDPVNNSQKLACYPLDKFQRHILHVLQKYPFWPSPCHSQFRAITFWSEHHLFLTLSSAYLYYHYLRREERAGRLDLFCVDADLSMLRKLSVLLRLYLEAHCLHSDLHQHGLAYLYEVNSVEALKYSFLAMLNLYDFAPVEDEEERERERLRKQEESKEREGQGQEEEQGERGRGREKEAEENEEEEGDRYNDAKTIREYARKMLHTIAYRLLQVTDPLTGSFTLSATGRLENDEQYTRLHGFDLSCLIKAMNGGVGPDAWYEPNYLTGALTTTHWVPTDSLFDVLHSRGSIAVHEMVTHRTEDTDTDIYHRLLAERACYVHAHLTEEDIVPFYWSAGLLVHPKFVSRAIKFMEDNHILDHPDLTMHQLLAAAFRRGLAVADIEHALMHSAQDFFSKHPNLLKVLASNLYLPLRILLEPIWLVNDSRTFNSKVIDMCEHIANHFGHWTNGQTHTNLSLSVYKQPGLVVSSFQRCNEGLASCEQSPWMVNMRGIPVFSRSGPGSTLFHTQCCVNFNSPSIQQRGDMLLVSYVSNATYYKVEESGPLKIHLFWPFSLFDDEEREKRASDKVKERIHKSPEIGKPSNRKEEGKEKSSNQWKVKMGSDLVDTVTHPWDFYYDTDGIGEKMRESTSKVDGENGERDLDFGVGDGQKERESDLEKGKEKDRDKEKERERERAREREKQREAAKRPSITKQGSKLFMKTRQERELELEIERAKEREAALVWRIAEYENIFVAVLPSQSLIYNEGPLPWLASSSSIHPPSPSPYAAVSEKEKDIENGIGKGQVDEEKEKEKHVGEEGQEKEESNEIKENTTSDSLMTDSFYTTNRFVSFVVIVGRKYSGQDGEDNEEESAGVYYSVSDFVSQRLRHIRLVEEKVSTGPGKTFVQRLHRSIHTENYVAVKVFNGDNEVFTVEQMIDDSLHPIGSAFKGAVEGYHWTKTHVVQPMKRFTKRVSVELKKMFNNNIRRKKENQYAAKDGEEGGGVESDNEVEGERKERNKEKEHGKVNVKESHTILEGDEEQGEV
jgi:hypothetical protein